MIKIVTKQNGTESYYDFTVVIGDSGQFTVTPKVNGQTYVMQTGDSIDLKISKTPRGTAELTLTADSNRVIAMTAEQSRALGLGDFYCDITLNYAGGGKDTFIKIPIKDNVAISNFHVTYGV